MATPHSTIRWARRAAVTAFFLDGFTFGSWVTRIPAIQEKLHLSNATLGFALLMSSVGALVTMPVVGRLAASHGSRLATTLSVALFGAALVLPGLATGAVSLGLSLFLFGCGFGGVNVAANSQAVSVERRHGKPIMGSFHASFSLGGMVGAAIGSLAAAARVSPLIHFCVVAGLVISAALLLGRHLIADEEASATPGSRAAGVGRIAPALLFLGAIAFCTMLGEGTMADWSAVFLRQVSHSSAPVAALGFGAFSTTMLLGRLLADRVTASIGRVRLVRLGGTLAASGLLIAMLLPGAATAIAGFAFVGLGLAALVPAVFSAAGQTPGVPASVSIATVSTIGYFGFLCGPPLIGLASQAVTLRWAIAIVFVAACVAVALSRNMAVGKRRGGVDRTIGLVLAAADFAEMGVSKP